MSNPFESVKERLSIQVGSENEFAKRTLVSAGSTAVALSAVFLGIDSGIKEVFYPLAGITEAVSVYQGDRSAVIAFRLAKNAVLNMFDESKI